MFSVALRHRHYPFQALNELLGKDSEERSGDRTIGPRRPRREGARCRSAGARGHDARGTSIDRSHPAGEQPRRHLTFDADREP